MTTESGQTVELTDVEEALNGDSQLIGDIYREMNGDVESDPQLVAEKLGLPAPTVYYYKRHILTLLEKRRQSNAPSTCARTARMLRNFIKRHRDSLQPETIEQLQELSEEHDKVASDREASAIENQVNEQQARKADASLASPSGVIYVYSYPHYLKYPVLPIDEDNSNSQTFMKIGKTIQEVGKRIRQQSTPEIPEPPVVLRHYTLPDGASLDEIESKLHGHLNSVDHNMVNRRGSGAGSEWFLTHLVAIDSTASLLGLTIQYAHEDW